MQHSSPTPTREEKISMRRPEPLSSYLGLQRTSNDRVVHTDEEGNARYRRESDGRSALR